MLQHTTDPESQRNPVKEGAGAVASDSLAAESARSGGAFGENRDSNPLSVPGSKSTFANTDTSGATTLPPGRDARDREDTYGDSGSGEKDSGSRGGLGGAFSDGGAGGPSADKISSSGQDNRGSNADSSNSGSGASTTSRQGYGDRGAGGGASTTSGQHYASADSSSGGSSSGGDPSAPGYVSSVTQPEGQFGQGKPKGKNITEASEDDFNKLNRGDAEIGSENDPGRRAEQDFQKKTQSASGGTGPNQRADQGGDSQYSSLKEDQEL